MDDPLYFFGMAIIAILAIVGIIHALNSSQGSAGTYNEVAELRVAKNKYDEALKGTDKAEALRLGRIYHILLRKGPLTIYDEQALTNDLSTMKTDNTVF